MTGPAGSTAGGKPDQTANIRGRREVLNLLMLQPVSQRAHQDSVRLTRRPWLAQRGWRKKTSNGTGFQTHSEKLLETELNNSRGLGFT